MEILYKVHNNLYINLTNRCPCACEFCLRQNTDRVGESDNLWLEREPAAEEVIAAFSKFDLRAYDEVVFCGFGEPVEALPVLLEVARYVKTHFTNPVRLNTNGLGNLIWERDITPEFSGVIDIVSISLNTPNAARYAALTHSKFGERSFDALLDFARRCTEHVPQVVMSTVETTISHEEEAECQKICEEIGVTYRIRPWQG